MITGYNPDVLSCLANLSNDEVFTPPEVANAMLDMLPQELFSDPATTFLDPACKSGVFLREIAKRLLDGQLPGWKERVDAIDGKKSFGEPLSPEDEAFQAQLQATIDHIFHKQLFAISITELTSLLSRRSVYCSKYPNSIYSVTKFDDQQGNIRFKRIKHKWDGGKCIFCGASQKEYDRSGDLETHAYEFIHTTKPEKVFNMKFDVIIGNPPYQLSDGGAQASASPLYNLFVQQAKKLSPRYMSMIIPARWYAGGKGLDTFRDEMLDDEHIRILHDFPITDDCFPGVNIRGGVCYFLWERDYDNRQGLTTVVTHNGKDTFETLRKMRYQDLNIFIRYGQALQIMQKIGCDGGENSLMQHVSPRKPFGLSTDFSKTASFHATPKGLKTPVACYGKGLQVGYVERRDIPAHTEWIDKYKIMTSRANNIGTELNDDNLNAFICRPQFVCTESYMVIGADLNMNETECENMVGYLKTRFVRFCHSLAKASQDATAKTYRFVPIQDFSKPWTDEELYAKYGLTEEEIAFIESMIKPME